MTSQRRTLWQRLTGRQAASLQPEAERPAPELSPAVDLAPNDPILAYFQGAKGPVVLEDLKLESAGLAELKAANVKVVIPLVNQGELMGLIHLGPRLSDQEYSGDDFRLLGNLATHTAPALRVAQLVQEQQREAQERERIQHELQVAQLIQQTLLPKESPQLEGWEISTYYQPAREVGGDFYEFFSFPDGRLAMAVADVTDKGVPAALVMATTRSILRAAAERLVSPGKVLERVNEILCPEIPANMFVTCFYVLLDPATGTLSYANAGHDLPYIRKADPKHPVEELRARGMPLGLMPGMNYEELETSLDIGDSLLLYSDGLVEAHAPDGEMFGFPRLQRLMAHYANTTSLVEYLLNDLQSFVGAGWEQEDDITFVVLERETTETKSAAAKMASPLPLLSSFELPSEVGNEREAAERVGESIQALEIEELRLERLKTAVAEATMNAMEHGNRYQAELPVRLQVLRNDALLKVRVTDQGGEQAMPDAQTPDLDAKLAGQQSPRGWGLFLIKNMVDEMETIVDGKEHTIELVLNLQGGDDV